ncbi:MAG: metal ABC transporter substrate-binding protein [Deltaproteobacteria bacterium]|nr:metal ABC transporter substrate-binding protein [Deltaproteobacteria bacterium]
MKKIIFTLLILLPINVFAKVNVVTTTPDLAAIAREVGGVLVDVKSIARGDQNPHYLEPKPSFILLVNKADLLIEVGLELEVGWLPVLLTQSRNPKIQRGNPGHLSASEGLRILEIPTGPIDRSQGDTHPEGNPHYWLHPANGIKIAQNIAARLGQIDPTNKSAYEQNTSQFVSRLQRKITGWKNSSAGFRGKKIVTHHKSFSYFVDFTGLTVVDFVEPKPGIPPPPSHIMSLMDRIRKDKIPLIITENYYDTQAAKEIARKTGIKALVLASSVGGAPGVNTYEALFDYLIGEIKNNL